MFLDIDNVSDNHTKELNLITILTEKYENMFLLIKNNVSIDCHLTT